MIPQKFSPLIFGLILSGLMSLLVSGISIVRSSGLGHGFASSWMDAWLTAWLFAFPIVLLVAPLTRAAVARLTATP
jgi:hypothetical protein